VILKDPLQGQHTIFFDLCPDVPKQPPSPLVLGESFPTLESWKAVSDLVLILLKLMIDSRELCLEIHNFTLKVQQIPRVQGQEPSEDCIDFVSAGKRSVLWVSRRNVAEPGGLHLRIYLILTMVMLCFHDILGQGPSTSRHPYRDAFWAGEKEPFKSFVASVAVDSSSNCEQCKACV